MAGIIDASILLYAANSSAEEHPAAMRFINAASASADTGYFTEGLLYEFLRVATHPKIFERPLTWKESMRFLTSLFDSDRFQALGAGENHWSILPTILQRLQYPAGNLFFDLRTVRLMHEHGIMEIHRADTDFLQFPDIRVFNPILPED